jgi:hypothetical protein
MIRPNAIEYIYLFAYDRNLPIGCSNMKVYKKIIIYLSIFAYALSLESTNSIGVFYSAAIANLVYAIPGGLVRAIPLGKAHKQISSALPCVSGHTIREGILAAIKYYYLVKSIQNDDSPSEKFSFAVQQNTGSISGFSFWGIPGPDGELSKSFHHEPLNRYFLWAILRESLISMINNILIEQAESYAEYRLENYKVESRNVWLKSFMVSSSGSLASFAWSYIISQLRAVDCAQYSLIPASLSYGFRLEINGLKMPTLKFVFYG